MYWVGLGCLIERSNEDKGLANRKAYDAFEAALEVTLILTFSVFLILIVTAVGR